MGTGVFILSTLRDPARVTVTVSGRLDQSGLARLRVELAAWRDAGAVDVIVDVSGMPRCGPELARALARTLAWARWQLRVHGGNLIVTGAGTASLAELDAAMTALQTEGVTELRPAVGSAGRAATGSASLYSAAPGAARSGSRTRLVEHRKALTRRRLQAPRRPYRPPGSSQ